MKKNILSVILILFLSLVGALLAGCHPCTITQCGSWVHAEAFIGKDGEVYIDIPGKEKYKSNELHSISISMTKSNNRSGDYWESVKSFSTDISHKNKTGDFPIKYGTNVPGAISRIPPRKIENGTYVIRGFVFLIDTGRDTYDLTGEFTYNNGAIENVK